MREFCPIVYIQGEDRLYVIPTEPEDQRDMEDYIAAQLSEVSRALIPIISARVTALLERAANG